MDEQPQPSDPAPEEKPVRFFRCEHHPEHIIGVVTRHSRVRRLLVLWQSQHDNAFTLAYPPQSVEDGRVAAEVTGTSRVKCTICHRISEWHTGKDAFQELMEQRLKMYHPCVVK